MIDLKTAVDALIVIPNQRLLSRSPTEIDAADRGLQEGRRGAAQRGAGHLGHGAGSGAPSNMTSRSSSSHRPTHRPDQILLEMFPEARFVHIHRDPCTVSQSITRTRPDLPFGRLQRTDQFDWTERIIRQYKELHDAFFEERSLIPAGHFTEMGCCEELEEDPVGEVSEALRGPGVCRSSATSRRRCRTTFNPSPTTARTASPNSRPDVRQRIGRRVGEGALKVGGIRSEKEGRAEPSGRRIVYHVSTIAFLGWKHGWN